MSHLWKGELRRVCHDDSLAVWRVITERLFMPPSTDCAVQRDGGTNEFVLTTDNAALTQDSTALSVVSAGL